jgi:lysophospholipase L1-like esterase
VPIEPGRNGSDYLAPCLLSHRPVDLVIIMLGTNDLKGIYGQTASEIACGAGALIDLARGTLAGPGDRPPRVLLVSPIPVVLTPHSEMWGFGNSIEEGERLAGMYALMAAGKGVGFFDAGSVTQVSPLDGVHLDEAGHAALGAAMAEAVRGELARG